MMTKSVLTAAAHWRRLALVGALGAFLPSVHAQTASASASRPAPTAAQVLKYDKNNDGKLDADELAAMDAAEGKTITLSPFQVSTDKDYGYAAGNTLSGGRMDTPLKLTAASISVMTKEFLDDFAITDMNEASGWTIGVDAPGGGEQGPFGGNRFQASFRGGGNGQNYPSRNGALEYFNADSYNTERLEFQRGPNSALFGDSGPGGTQGSSSKQARLNNRATSIRLRGDSYGGYRSELDVNYGMERVALRFNALYQNTKAYQDGTSNKQKAATFDVTYKISESTQLRAEYSHSDEWNIQYRRTYSDNSFLWNRTTFNNDNTTILAATATAAGISTLGNATTDRLTWNFSTNSLINYKGIQYQTNGLGYATPWGGRPDLSPNFVGIAKNFNLGPADSIADRDLNARSINLDHRFSPNLFLNVAWISSDIDPATVYSQGLPNDRRIDINKLLPDGKTNPNFGKAYAEWSQNSQYQSNNVNEFRFNLNNSFSVPKLFQLKQSFLLNGGWRQDLYEAWNRTWRRTDNPAQLNPNNSVNQLTFRQYYGDARGAMAPVLGPTIGGLAFKNIDSGFLADNNRRLIYGQIVSQSSFFDDRLGLNLSFRRDKNLDDVSSGIGQTADGYNVIMGAQNPKTLQNEAGRRGVLNTFRNSKSAGVVVYPFPESWGRWVSPIGFVANYSQNFSIPNTGANFINGLRPTPPVATTKDIGLRYSMPGGKAYATLSHYNTEQTGNLITFGNQSDFRAIWLNLGYSESNLSGADFNYRDTNSRKLEGWEFELNANPSRNLTLTFNYSHPIVTTISDSPDRRAYYAANLAQFTAGANAAPGAVLNGHTIVTPQLIKDAMQNIENSFNGFTPGTLANNLERHRMNLVGSYRFSEGKMKGFGFNAGVQYRGHKKVGSVDPIIKFGLQRSATVAETAQAAYDYLWVEPTFSTTAGANYTRRYGKYTVRYQLNIANLINDAKPQWSSYSTINAGQLNNNSTSNVLKVAGGNDRMQVLSGFNQLDPRKFTFTSTLSF